MAQDDYTRRINPDDFNSNTGIGVDLPLVSDNINTFKLNYQTLDQIKADLKNLILTNQGERYMLPTYGTTLREVLFELDPDSILSQVRTIITDAVQRWLPIVIITDLQLFQDNKNEHKFFIELKYTTQYDQSVIDEINIDITI